MKIFILLSLAIISSNIVKAQSKSEKIYVCTPCGYTCDATEYKSTGTCSACGMAFVEKSTVQFGNINFAEACKRISRNKNVLLLDVRSEGEFTGDNTEINSFGHLKNAINVNVSDLPSRLGELEEYKNAEIIVYCSHSHRSPRAAYLMTTSGFNNVTNVLGGVSILESQFGNDTCVTDLFVSHQK